VIFVTVGTYDAPFDRLLAALAEVDVDEPLVIQCGHSAIRPRGAECLEFMPFEAIVAHAQRARVVVAHAGVGSVLVALTAGHRPILVPRLRAYGEAVDDHQLEFARKLADIGLARLVEDPAGLGEALTEPAVAAPAGLGGDEGALCAELRGYVADTIAASRS
jgi:UDP-N-acetylglucosamine transferase subunit ALG13